MGTSVNSAATGSTGANGSLLSGARIFRPQVIATGGALANATWGGSSRYDNRVEARHKYRMGRQGATAIQLGFSGFYINSNGEQLFTGDLDIEAAFESVSPVYYANAFFDGKRLGNLPIGAAYVLSDPIGVYVPAGSAGDFLIRHGHSSTNGNVTLPGGSTPSPTGGISQLSQSDTSQIAGTGAMSTPSGGTTIGGPKAVLILGKPDAPMVSVAYLTDSIGDGTGDTATSDGVIGFAARGLEGVNGYLVPSLKQTVGSWTFAKSTIDYAPRLRAQWEMVTHLMCALGTNDIASATSLSSMQAYATAVWQAAKRTIGPYGKPLQVAQALIMPRTTSTDSWATAGNQTPVAGFTTGGVRDQFNAWVKAQVGQGLLDAAIDVNQYVEDQAHPGCWITTGSANYPTTDGIHPSTAVHILAAQAVNSWAAAQNP